MKQPNDKESTTREVLAAIFPQEAGRPTEPWLQRLARNGTVPHTRKIGRSYLFDAAAVRKALKANGIIP